MKTSIKKLLLPHQIDHVTNLSKKLSDNYVCFDCSDTGTGKTYSAIATAKCLKMKVFIICPKTIMSAWRDVVAIFGVECLGISNYELLIREKHIDNGKVKKCPYIARTGDQQIYEWSLPAETLVIFDEVHRCCNPESLTGNLLLSLKNVYDKDHLLLLLTATICDGPHKFKLFSVLLKWCSNCNSVFHWLEKSYNPVMASEIIKERLAVKNMCKVSISDLGDTFQKNQVTSDYYDVKKTDGTEIDKLHEEIKNCMEKIKHKSFSDKDSNWASVIRARQKIELLKVQIFVDLAQQYIDNDFSVVIFVNYTDTLLLLLKTLGTDCSVYGEQTITQRMKNINDFIKDKKRIIVCNIQCGGDSISLNDKNGKYKRVALVSPPLSSLKLIQACGRISRADSKTPSFNKIVFANSTIEKQLCNKLKSKCSIYSAITDHDLMYDEKEDV
jgi:superfamily II DNA or RNA helicase